MDLPLPKHVSAGKIGWTIFRISSNIDISVVPHDFRYDILGPVTSERLVTIDWGIRSPAHVAVKHGNDDKTGNDSSQVGLGGRPKWGEQSPAPCHISGVVCERRDSPDVFQSNVEIGLNPMPPYEPVIIPRLKLLGAIHVIQFTVLLAIVCGSGTYSA
jgi:hypothetical protein